MVPYPGYAGYSHSCRLNETSLAYYKLADDPDPVRTIDLKEVQNIVLQPAEADAPEPTKFTLFLTSEDRSMCGSARARTHRAGARAHACAQERARGRCRRYELEVIRDESKIPARDWVKALRRAADKVSVKCK